MTTPMSSLAEPIFQADASQTDLPTALQLMSGLSRNRFLVQALDAHEQVLGEIEVKGGMVLRAEAGDLKGREAVYALLNLHPRLLSAYHVKGGDLDESVGSLERLLMEGAVVIDELSRTEEEEPAPRIPTFPGLDAVDTTPAPLAAPAQPVPAAVPAALPTPAPQAAAAPARSVPWGLIAALAALLVLVFRRS